MNYGLHPGARENLREAAELYREKAGTALSQSLLAAFEHSISLLLQHPARGAIWRYGKRRLAMRRFRHALIFQPVHFGPEKFGLSDVLKYENILVSCTPSNISIRGGSPR